MLPITVPFHDDETPVSATSRLARANGVDRAWRFCLDMGFTFQGVVDGDQTALDRLAALGGFNRARLGDGAFVKGPDGFVLKGQLLRSANILRTHAMVCPRCLAADMGDTRVAVPVRPYGRALWQINGVRTCFEHGTPLIEYRAETMKTTHDFTAIVEPRFPEIEWAAEHSEERSPTTFETYIRDRVSHGIGGSSWLDKLPLYVAINVCEVMGAVAVHGPKVRITALNSREMWNASATGYNIAAAGEAGIVTLLEDLQDQFRRGRSDWGPTAMFGRLYEWLAHETDDEAYAPLRELIRQHVVDTMPVGPGDTLFGEDVTERKNHSIQSASQVYGLHPKRLRKVLSEAGYLDESHTRATDERVLFNARSAEPFLRRLSRAITMNDVGNYLNAARPTLKLLVDNGYICPFVGKGSGKFGHYAFDPDELNAFLARLSLNADCRVEHLTPIPNAAKRANCSQMEIVELLLNDQLSEVGLDPESWGYSAICVQIDEVRDSVCGPEHGGIRLQDVKRRMKYSDPVLNSLVAERILPSRTAINPTNRCPQTVVDPVDLDTFDKKYVSLFHLSRETGVHFHSLLRKLRGRDIHPAPGFENVPAKFYYREEIEHLEIE